MQLLPKRHGEQRERNQNLLADWFYEQKSFPALGRIYRVSRSRAHQIAQREAARQGLDYARLKVDRRNGRR